MATTQIPRLDSQLRDRKGSRYSKRLRQTGQLPAVIYGHKQDVVHIAVAGAAVTDLIQQHAHIVELAVDGKPEPCLIKDIQWDHLGSTIVHVDFARVDLTERVEVEVQLVLVGEPIGLKEAHTFLDHVLPTLEIECLATEIPEVIKVDVNELQAGESISVGDLKLPEGVTPVTPEEAVVASVQHSKAEEEEELEATEAESAAEPEVVKKGKAEEDEAEKA